MDYFIVYLALGAITGIFAGMLGVGGGLLIVPVLVWLFTQQGFDSAIITHLAIGTSLATIIPTALLSSYAHHRHKAVRWDLSGYLIPGALVGALLGAAFAGLMPEILLRRIFGVFELVMAAYLLLNLKPKPSTARPKAGILLLASTAIGSVSALLGIGGGTLVVPLLTWFQVSLRQAIATAAAVGLPIALGGVAGFIWHGLQTTMPLPEGATGYVFWPAFAGIAIASIFSVRLGAWMTHHLPVALIRYVFAALLIILGLKMLLS